MQALGTGVDGVIDQPSLGKHVTVTNIRGIHGAPVSEAAIMGMLALEPRPAALGALPGREQLDALAAEADRRQDRRHLRHRPDRRGAGAALQGVRHDGVGFTSTKREVPGFDRMLLRSELIATASELDYLVLLVPYSEETRHSSTRACSPR